MRGNGVFHTICDDAGRQGGASAVYAWRFSGPPLRGGFWKPICADKGRMTGEPVRRRRLCKRALLASARLFIVHIRLRSEIPPVAVIHCAPKYQSITWLAFADIAGGRTAANTVVQACDHTRGGLRSWAVGHARHLSPNATPVGSALGDTCAGWTWPNVRTFMHYPTLPRPPPSWAMRLRCLWRVTVLFGDSLGEQPAQPYLDHCRVNVRSCGRCAVLCCAWMASRLDGTRTTRQQPPPRNQ